MKTKQCAALFLLAMLLLSVVPFALAERGDSSSRRGRGMEIEEEHESEIEDEIEIEHSEDSLDDSRLRKMDRLRVSKEEYHRLKEGFIKLKEKVREKKSEGQETRVKLRACSDVATNDCKSAKITYDGHISQLVAMVIAKLEETKAKMLSVDAPDDAATNAGERIDALITEINAQLAAVKSAATKDAYRKALGELKASVKNAQDYLKSALPQAFNYRLGGVLVKSEQLGAKLERLLQRAKESGKDMTIVAPLVASFKEKITEAKQKFEAARKLFADNKRDEAMKAMREAHQLLKDAHGLLKQIHRAFKSKSVDTASLSEASTVPANLVSSPAT